MTVQPMVVDANGDYTADLFGAKTNWDYESDEERGVWLFKPNARDQEPVFEPLANREHHKTPPIRRPIHSNAYVDLNGDGSADLFITAKNRFEIWINVPRLQYNSSVANYKHVRNLTIAGCHNDNEANDDKEGCAIGQVSFADIN